MDRKDFFGCHYCLHIYYCVKYWPEFDLYISTILTITLEKKTQVSWFSLRSFKFLLVRRLRDISVSAL